MFAPAPSPLPGQAGELTPELAKTLVEKALWHYGTFLMHPFTTGPELERGRQVALNRVAGVDMGPQRWLGHGTNLRLEAESPDAVVGFWLGADGRPTGERVRFTRHGGLWKLSDHTEGGEWAPVVRPGFASPRPMGGGLGLLGIDLGMHRREVVELLGPPDAADDGPLHYALRDLAVELDPSGEVMRISTRSGASWRGLRIGDPAELARHLYGEPLSVNDGWWVYRGGNRQLRIRMQADAQGTERVAELLLESR